MEASDTTNKPNARVSERNSLDFIQKVAPFDLFLSLHHLIIKKYGIIWPLIPSIE
ncbi:hypothetical protein B4121_3654 [Bacillus paralicheniformis]|uniref:Uncharacterized protein n=1 Tax=Bacillus paralicheniformis TaxID=1648923 RepID=A0A7Z0WVR6_9BACI|nr:hypothetical protein B4121_3654 [Bacillus paralicheniformis]